MSSLIPVTLAGEGSGAPVPTAGLWLFGVIACHLTCFSSCCFCSPMVRLTVF